MFRFLFRFILLMIVIAAVLLAHGLLLPTGPQSQRFVQLKPGSSARHIAARLQRAGVIRSHSAFLLWSCLRAPRSFKAGEYACAHRANGLGGYGRIDRGA